MSLRDTKPSKRLSLLVMGTPSIPIVEHDGDDAPNVGDRFVDRDPSSRDD